MRTLGSPLPGSRTPWAFRRTPCPRRAGPPGATFLGGAAGLGIQRGGKGPSDRCAAPVVGIVPHGWAATLRTILP